MSTYYEDGKEIIVIDDVSFTSPTGNNMKTNGSSASTDANNNSREEDTSITPIHISSDEDSDNINDSDEFKAPPGAIIQMDSQSSDEDNILGNTISPMILHSQEIVADDDDIFAVKQIFPTTINAKNISQTSSNDEEEEEEEDHNNNNNNNPGIFIKPKAKKARFNRNNGSTTTTTTTTTTTNTYIDLSFSDEDEDVDLDKNNNNNNNDENNEKSNTKKNKTMAKTKKRKSSSESDEGATKLSKKELAKRKRQEAKKLAREQKELEKQRKKLKRQETLRANGKFQFDEIVVNVENSLYESPIGQSISKTIEEEEKYGSKIANFKVINSNDNSSNATNKYVRNSIEWTHEIPGKQCSGFVWTAVVYSGDDFYDFIVDYKKKWQLNQIHNTLLFKLVEGLRLYQKPWITEFKEKRDQSNHFGVKYVKSKPRILLLVAEWSKCLSSRNKKNRKKNTNLITESDVMAISNKLYIEYDVEVQCFDSIERVGKELKGITRYLATKPYNKDKNSLSFLKKARVPMTQSFFNDSKRELRRTWMRMLMQINGVSAKKALNITNSYPTFKTLYDEYHNHNLTVDERKNLLSGIISDNGRSSYALSSRIFTFMTEDDHKHVL